MAVIAREAWGENESDCERGTIRMWGAIEREPMARRLVRAAHAVGRATVLLLAFAVVVAVTAAATGQIHGLSRAVSGLVMLWLSGGAAMDFQSASLGAAEALRFGYAREPVAMIALMGALAVPALAIVFGNARAMMRRRLAMANTVVAHDVVTEPREAAAAAWIWLEHPGGSPVRVGELAAIGRGEDCDLMLADPSLAEMHAIIQRSADGCFSIVDVSADSEAMLTVNDAACRAAPLRDGDAIALGGWQLVFRCGMPDSYVAGDDGDEASGARDDAAGHRVSRRARCLGDRERESMTVP